MGGSRNIQAPKPQASEYTPVYQKDGNYYKRDAPTQAKKGGALGNVAQHGGNPVKASKNKGKASVPSYTRIDGGMARTADMPKSANRFNIADYRGQHMMGRQPAGRRSNQMAYRANAGQMNHLGKGIF